jgi:uncharacterized protein YycO
LKYIFISIFFIFALKSDINFFNFYNFKWSSSIVLKKSVLKLKPGDILIKKKELKYLEWFGHCGIVTKNYDIAEIISPFSTLKYTHLNVWADEGSSIIVLRPKRTLSPEFYILLFNTIENSRGKKYGLVSKKSKDKFYCSQFIWSMYNLSSDNFDLDFDSGLTVWPYDILFSNELIAVNLY